MPEAPSTARGIATRQRILDAAAEEFALRGIAGARVDRIISAASTNKAQLYGYFGSKDGLFDAVVAAVVDRMMTSAPFDGDDLAEWAVRVYDGNLAHPELVRLAAWVRLERRPTGVLFDRGDHQEKLDAIAAGQAAGRIRAGDPASILSLVVAMASAWSPASSTYAASGDDPDEEHRQRRDLLRAAVRGALAPERGD